MAKNEKSFGIKIDPELSERFSEHVLERGYTKYRAIEAALRAFIALPPEVQVGLMSNKVDAFSILKDTFKDVNNELKNLTDEQKSQIIMIAKEISKKTSNKKG
jgi:septation ring formation regulator EzrA